MGTGHQIAFFVRELSQATDPKRRAAAAKGLGRLGGPEHAAPLTEAARDPDPAVRTAAAIGLGRLGAPGTDHVLITLTTDDAPQVRRQATRAVNRLALTGPQVVEAFARLLTDEEWHVRLNAVTGLRRLGVPGDADALLRLLDDPHPQVRGHAHALVSALMPDDDTVSAAVLRTAWHGPDRARAAALRMLPAPPTAEARRCLLTGLRSRSPDVRLAAVCALHHDPASQTTDALVTALEAERAPQVAQALLSVLGRRGEHRLAPTAVRWLDHPDVAAWAMHALADIDAPGAVERIRSALTRWRNVPSVRAAAARTLARLGDRHAAATLAALAHDPDLTVRYGAMDGMALLGDRRRPRRERRMITEVLLDRLTGDPALVWFARNALAHYPEALPRLRRLTATTTSHQVRAAALSLLEPHDVDYFLAHLNDPVPAVRHQALYGLLRCVRTHGDLPPNARDGAVGVLTDLARDDDAPHVREAARTVLEALGAPPGRAAGNAADEPSGSRPDPGPSPGA
ncbi:HEAT repeat domain-containing protein [Thermomonospora catenispora]|uniref:HEAT repeat domain-containing protein n=1 Tax=Thermomonospora catenispora TaxID=2493090 RepID=UPI00111D0AF6|nr:HEAT repeat domain-containing protein [Thermomonospora catenispora]TNY37812.1 hypothetical protein EIO00_06565 [Thermomonospora catenispora]